MNDYVENPRNHKIYDVKKMIAMVSPATTISQTTKNNNDNSNNNNNNNSNNSIKCNNN